MAKRTNKAGRLFSPLVTGLALLTGACDLGVSNPGAITDDALDDATLMEVVTNGVANEFNILTDNLAFDNARLTDDLAGTGSYFETGRFRRGAMDWEETDDTWGFVHETIWTGQQAWGRMVDLDDFDQNTSPLAARVWLLMGLAHRAYGENFCQVVYSVGQPDGGGVLPRTAAFDSAIVALNQAVTIGTAAGADATDFVTAAHAGLGQAYAAKGEFATALTHSAMVPTEFSYDAIYNRQSNTNLTYVETIGRAELGVFATYVQRLAGSDPRAPFTICGTFDDPDNPKNSDVTPTGAAGCTSHQGADGTTAHYQQQKFDDFGSDIPVASGLEMRLIEAEASLRDNDLTGFTTSINEVRSFFELPDVAEPAAAGALEYPNAYDATTGGAIAGANAADVDAWSILDGERYLTLWLEGRRLWDMHRWDHPFLDGGIVFWDSEPRRVSCYSVPQIECQLNQTLKGSTLLTGVGAGTQSCN